MDDSFGKWLVQQRKARRISQARLALEIGYADRSVISWIEQGRRLPSADFALCVAAWLQLPADERDEFVLAAQLGRAPALRERRIAFLASIARPASKFVGREKELEDILALLRSPGIRFVTLTGIGGVGKTRLSLEVAERLLKESPLDPPLEVHFLDLSSLEDYDLVVPVIARALGVKEVLGETISETLLRQLRQKELLLVLDNFEHLLEAALEVGKLAWASGKVKVLATSRVPLRIRIETPYQLPPLSLPESPHSLSFEHMEEYEAVRLFVEQAASARPGFQLTSTNAEAIAEICIRMDGLPLGLELAAARVKYLPLHVILQALESGLALASRGPVDLEPRQRSLRAVVEWSYDFLDESAKMILRALSVFSGGAALRYIQRVCKLDIPLQGSPSSSGVPSAGDSKGVASMAQEVGTPELPDASPNASASTSQRLLLLDGLMELVDNSLLRQEDDIRLDGDLEAEPRYSMLNTIRDYACGKLEESGEAELLRKEHAYCFLELVEEAGPHLTDDEQTKWLARLDREHENVTSALHWAAEHAEKGDEDAAEKCLRAAGSMWRYWYTKGSFSEGRAIIARALSLRSPAVPQVSRSRAIALLGVGALAWMQGDHSFARGALEEALAMARQIEDGKTVANCVNILGVIAHDQGYYRTARAMHEESLALRRALHDEWGIARSLHNLGRAPKEEGDFLAARALFEESLALHKKVKDTMGIPGVVNGLGVIAYELEDYQLAKSLHEESIARYREIGDRGGIASSTLSLANTTRALAGYDAAISYYEQSLELCRLVGSKAGEASVLNTLGVVAQGREDYTAARTFHRESLVLRHALGDRKGMLACLAGMGALALTEGKLLWAGALLGVVGMKLRSMGCVLDRDDRLLYERSIEAAQRTIGGDELERMANELRDVECEQVVTWALQEDSADSTREDLLAAMGRKSGATAASIETVLI